jgi:hypothetical protein
VQHPQPARQRTSESAWLQLQELAASDDIQWVLSQGLAEAVRQLRVQQKALTAAAADGSSSSSRSKVSPLHYRLFESLGTAALLDAPQQLINKLPRTLDDEIDIKTASTACLSCQLVTVPINSGGGRVNNITVTLLLRRMAVQLEACYLQPEAVVLQLALQTLIKTRSDLFHQVLADNPNLGPSAVEEKTETALGSIIPAVLKQLLPALMHAVQHADLQAGECRAAGACMGLLMSRLLTSE